ncbi:MAG: PEFG-CTERM sorting domain-containing protein [Cenarchaeum symbiont of Oopsacas minuta]|nr:hypothetical protein [Cenarchaeum symbiont of Oopsacas minuta]MDI1496361.1 PEFG-CTERM sorting domain-containing protein [Cenarchaeum symbiont of Oopsacas minuta]
MRHWIIVFLVFVIMVSTSFAYGQANTKQLDIYTPSLTYYEGDVLVIGGSISKIIMDTPVTIRVYSSSDTVVDIAQIDVALDGSFAHTMIAFGPQWVSTGEYRIEAKYGEESDYTNFQFLKTEIRQAITSNYDVDAGNSGTFDVGYTIHGGSVDEILVDTHGLSLVLSITAQEAGEITMNIPKEFIDALDSNGNKIDFIVLVDNIEVGHTESNTDSANRKITVGFSDNNSEIRIIGTHAIPEFGTMMILVFVVAISVIVLVSFYPSRLKIVF